MKCLKTIIIFFIFFLITVACDNKKNDLQKYAAYTKEEISYLNKAVLENYGMENGYYSWKEKSLPSFLQMALLKAIKEKNYKEIDRALYFGADINYIYYSGEGLLIFSMTPLWVSIFRTQSDPEYFSVFKHLIACGANVYKTNEEELSALEMSIGSRKEIFDYLISNNFKINHKDIYNRNALFKAVSSSDSYYIRKLLDLGIEVNNISSKQSLDGRNKWTCLDIAIEKGNQEYIDLLRAAGAKTADELGTK